MASKGQKFRKWSKEEKLEIIKRHLDDHISIRALGKEYQINTGQLCNWIKRYTEEGEAGLDRRAHRGNPYAALSSNSLSEVDRLKLIIMKQEIEIERLKKGYTVRGVGADKEFVTGSDVNTKSSKRSK